MSSRLRVPRLSTVHTLILKEKQKNPHASVRALADLMLCKYRKTVSKSTVSNVLAAHGVKQKSGRKKAILRYRNTITPQAGLYLLRSMDSWLGLFDHVAEELNPYVPHLTRKAAHQILILLSCAAFLRKDLTELVAEPGFIPLGGGRAFPAKKAAYLVKRIKEYTPVITLKGLPHRLALVSTVKFYFANGSVGYCDGRFATFWDGVCHRHEFFAPLGRVQKILRQVIKTKVVIISYTKSFDYLSSLVIKFMEGVASSITKIEVVGEKGDMLDRIIPHTSFRPSFLIGYLPKIVAKSMVFLEKNRRFKKLIGPLEEVFYTQVLVRFVLPKNSKGVIVNNILINRKRRALPVWGLLTNRKGTVAAGLLEEYLGFYPYLEGDFQEDITLLDQYSGRSVQAPALASFLPPYISLAGERDCGNLAEILAELLSVTIGHTDVYHKPGVVYRGKYTYKIIISGLSEPIKQRFNRAGLSFDNKPVFLI